MDQATFLEKFGAVFEHSPGVAEAVFKAGGDLLGDAETLCAKFASMRMASGWTDGKAVAIGLPDMTIA